MYKDGVGQDAAMTSTRWRAFQEEQAIGGHVLPLLAGLTRRGPRPITDTVAVGHSPARRNTVSVVIPCYNYGRFLPAAVESALCQRDADVEVIIVDDCSTDDSRDIAALLVGQHERVKLLVNPRNAGHVRSFNAGWEASTGEYIVKLDADDLLTPNSLGRATALLEAHPSVGFAYGHPRHFTTDVPPQGRVGASVRWRVWSGSDWLGERCRLGVSAITNPELVLRSSLLKAWGPMDPGVAYAPDMEISLRIAAVADVGRVDGADQALHREHGASMSETDGSGVLVDLAARRSAFERGLRAVADAEARKRLRRQADQALAQDALRYASSAADRGRHPSEWRALLGFAREVFPSVVDTPVYRRLERGRKIVGPARAGATARRLSRRVRQELYFSRWMVSGV